MASFGLTVGQKAKIKENKFYHKKKYQSENICIKKNMGEASAEEETEGKKTGK